MPLSSRLALAAWTRVLTKSSGPSPQADAPKRPAAAGPDDAVHIGDAERKSPEQLLLQSRDVIENCRRVSTRPDCSRSSQPCRRI